MNATPENGERPLSSAEAREFGAVLRGLSAKKRFLTGLIVRAMLTSERELERLAAGPPLAGTGEAGKSAGKGVTKAGKTLAAGD